MFGLGNDGIVVLGFWMLLMVYVRLQYRNSLRHSGSDHRSRRDPYDLAELNALVRESEQDYLLRKRDTRETAGEGKDMRETITHGRHLAASVARYTGGKRTGRKGF